MLVAGVPLCASNFEKRPMLPIEQALSLIEPIKEDAIVIGEGSTDVYAFIDPICPRSRDFVSMITESVKLQKRYKYHLFFYELKRFNSSKLIETIYSSKVPYTQMLKVMVEQQNLPFTIMPEALVVNKIGRIADVAQKLDVYKRPYLVMNKKKKTQRKKQ